MCRKATALFSVREMTGVSGQRSALSPPSSGEEKLRDVAAGTPSFYYSDSLVCFIFGQLDICSAILKREQIWTSSAQTS